MDEVFDEDCDDIEISRREWHHMKENRIKDGYKEGLNAGEESKLQEGFDDGYKHAVSQAYQLARMRGILCAILVKLHQEDPTAVGKDTQLTKKLVEEISNIEKDILQYIQSPASDETGLPGPSMAVLCCGGSDGQPCACASSPSSQSDQEKAMESGMECESRAEAVVPSGDSKVNHACDCSKPSADVSMAFSKKIQDVKLEVVSLLKKMNFSEEFIATL